MGDSGRPRFDRVDWSEVDPRTRRFTPERMTFLCGLLVVLALFLYDTYVVHVYIVGTYRAHPVDWVFLLGVVVLISFGLLPALRHRRASRNVLSFLGSQPRYAVATAALAAVVVAGAIGPVLMGEPRLRFEHRFHPPYGFAAPMGWTNECLGAVTQGEGITRYCHGSLSNPLGTNHRGHGLDQLLVSGARVTMYVMVFAAAFVVPLAAATGVVAGLQGGLADDLLMAYVDAQLSVPAIVVYFVGVMYWNTSLLLLLAAFGLLSWGGIARLVRGEVLQRREDGHVRVARSLGASWPHIARYHILPNVTNTLVPAVFQLLAILVLVEAGVAFLGFHDVELYSWGSIIAEGLDADHHAIGFEMRPHEVWWISGVPAAALALTLAALKLVGDGVRDALDPHRQY